MAVTDWKPTTELLIKTFILSRSGPEHSPTLIWHFGGLLVLDFIWFVSSPVSVLPWMAPMGSGVLIQPSKGHRTIVLQGGNWEHSLMRKLVVYVLESERETHEAKKGE